MDSRYLATHTRYVTKEEEREKQQKMKDRIKHAAVPSKRRDNDVQTPALCHGNACDDSLYSHDFQDKLVFG